MAKEVSSARVVLLAALLCLVFAIFSGRILRSTDNVGEGSTLPLDSELYSSSSNEIAPADLESSGSGVSTEGTGTVLDGTGSGTTTTADPEAPTVPLEAPSVTQATAKTLVTF